MSYMGKGRSAAQLAPALTRANRLLFTLCLPSLSGLLLGVRAGEGRLRIRKGFPHPLVGGWEAQRGALGSSFKSGLVLLAPELRVPLLHDGSRAACLRAPCRFPIPSSCGGMAAMVFPLGLECCLSLLRGGLSQNQSWEALDPTQYL